LPIPDFNYTVQTCDSNVQFNNISRNAKSFSWDFGDGAVSDSISPSHTYDLSGSIPVILTAVSSHNCTAEIEKSIYFISKKYARFEAALDSCNGNFMFNNVTEGSALYHWDFGDGTTSDSKNPVHRYSSDGNHFVELTLNFETQCADSAGKELVYESPLGEKVFIPNSFTPNGDGLNDFFHPSIFRPCAVYELTIFNRWGQKVFESEDASQVYWDGVFNGERLPQDIYVYLLKGDGKLVNGFINIQR
jgi:gliding motility-associated-like protein